MTRVVIIGNAAGGKSTLARTVAERRGLRLVELDRILWRSDWKLVPVDDYTRDHDEAIGAENWLIEGLGPRETIAPRLARATEIILVDLPLWLHYALAADRQRVWAQGVVEGMPGGIAVPPPTPALFEMMWRVDRDWMPDIRAQCDLAERDGKTVV